MFSLELYFAFLKKTSLIFFLMFLIAIPSLVSNITGNGVCFIVLPNLKIYIVRWKTFKLIQA